MKNKQISIVVLMFLVSVTMSYATSFYLTDNWFYHDSTPTDDIIFVTRTILPQIIDLTKDSSADMICYDWDNNNQYDNCYWDTDDGCGGSGCNANSCDFDDIPGLMPDSWKTGCDIDGGFNSCVIGSGGTPERICSGCDGVDSDNPISGFMDAKIFHDCDGLQTVEDLSPYDYKIVSSKKFDCNTGNSYDLEGRIGYNNWQIVADLTCEIPGTICSDDLDDQYAYKYADPIPDPCGRGAWAACNDTSECAIGKCIDNECSPCKSYECTEVNNNECVYEGEASSNLVYYCDYNHDLKECSSATHEPCEGYGGYYCTYKNSQWGWRFCTYGCNVNACITDVPGIAVSPWNLTYRI